MMLNKADIMPAKYQHVSSVIGGMLASLAYPFSWLAFGSKHDRAQLQPHRAASIAVVSLP